MQTLRQHTEVWAGLDAMKDIAVALFAVHCSWKNRGMQSRALLMLMLELDGGRCLDVASRDQVTTDYSVFIHVRSNMFVLIVV